MLFLILYMNRMFFISIFLLLTLSLTAYVLYRSMQLISPLPVYVKTAFAALYLLGALSFYFRMFTGDKGNLVISYYTGVAGFTWLYFFAMMAIITILSDLVRLPYYITGYSPQWVNENIVTVKLTAATLFALLITISAIVGNFRFNHPVIRRLDLSSETSRTGRSVKIVLSSDWHMSSYIAKRDVSRFVRLINDQDPDIVLIAGDLADRNSEPLIKLDMKNELSRIRSKYGIYAVPGNHDSYGNEKDELLKYFSSAGINVLRDSVVKTACGLYIIGRDDRSEHRRAPLDSLFKKTEEGFPVIVMDHQPYNLEETMGRALLHVSGHTHAGQFWPFNLVVKSMYEKSYGYIKKGTTHYYVSSGLGIWGPKIRTGSVSELVVITLNY